ncbi:hypothetical protein ABPG77_007759 [Micractinium sp. CCAP 211/92]
MQPAFRMTDNPEVGLDSVSPGTADVAQAEPAAEVTAEAGAPPPALQPAAAQAAAAAAQPATPATVPPAASGTLPAGSQQAGGAQQSLRQLAMVRWLDGDAAYLGLTAPEAAGLVPRSEPQLQPPAGTLLLYDQEKCPDYRRDGYEWKKVKVKYTLKVNGENKVSCFYDKPEVELADALQRRRYVLKDPGPARRLVLVQYKLPDPGAERRRRGPAAKAAAAVQATGAAGQDNSAEAGTAEGPAAPAAKRQRQQAAAAPSRRTSGAARQQQQPRRRQRQPEFVPAAGALEDCFAAIVGLLEQAGVPDNVQEAMGDAYERLDSSGLEQLVWWTRLDECLSREGGESAAQAFACRAAAQPAEVAAGSPA